MNCAANPELFALARAKRTALVMTLLAINNGAQTQAVNDDGDTLLTLAIATNNETLVRRLCSSAYTNDLSRALCCAVQLNRVRIASYLVRDVCTPINDACTCHALLPLAMAVKQRSYEMTALLLDAGADPNVRTSRFALPLALEQAVRDNNVPIVKLLLQGGANFVTSHLPDGMSALHLADVTHNRRVGDVIRSHPRSA